MGAPKYSRLGSGACESHDEWRSGKSSGESRQADSSLDRVRHSRGERRKPNSLLRRCLRVRRRSAESPRRRLSILLVGAGFKKLDLAQDDNPIRKAKVEPRHRAAMYSY